MIDLLTPRELAAELGVAPKTLANWRHTGTGPPFVKVGHAPRYRHRDVERWLETRTRRRTHRPTERKTA